MAETMSCARLASFVVKVTKHSAEPEKSLVKVLAINAGKLPSEPRHDLHVANF